MLDEVDEDFFLELEKEYEEDKQFGPEIDSSLAKLDETAIEKPLKDEEYQKKRKQMIRPIVPGKYGKLCKVDIPITEFLFGDNLDEKVDKLDKDDKSSDKLSMESGGGFFLGKRKHKWSQDSHWGPAKEKKLATGQILGKKQKETIETKDNALNASTEEAPAEIEMLTVEGFTLQEEDVLLVCTDESGDIKDYLCARYLVDLG
ncbi:Hypothetical predicted protein [Mytilus galloprovincialis]|uniref:Uncharacterized protein n=1 Tax=Mytilus galloprovincialis TaxID=29158 RepID=A0A8B6GV23_MYTGA|nr:Hypothetical predicted protein [Mytilus galloprovincialis]